MSDFICRSCGNTGIDMFGNVCGCQRKRPGSDTIEAKLPQSARETYDPAPGWGPGMPADLWLDEFGSQVWAAFGHPPYHVGSSLTGKQWRDVDVRLILPDAEYETMGLGDPARPHSNAKWVSLVLAYSALGRAMTGLPIDFQIQQQTYANEKYSKPRSCLGMVPLRMTR